MSMTDYVKQLRLIIGLAAFVYTSLFIGQGQMTFFLMFLILAITWLGVQIREKMERTAKYEGNPNFHKAVLLMTPADVFCRFSPIAVFSFTLNHMGMDSIHHSTLTLAMFSLTFIVMVFEHVQMSSTANAIRIR